MKRHLKEFVSTVAVLTVLATLLAASKTANCSEPTAEKPVKLLWATFTPPGDAATVTMEAFANELTKRSGGRVKVEFSLGGALAPAPQLYDKLLAGACDIVFFMPYIIPGVFPYSGVVELPVIVPRGEAGTKAVLSVMKKGFYDKEWNNVKLLWAFIGPGAVIYSRGKPITTVADFANKKIRTFGAVQASAMSALGAVPVSMPVGECYGALEKGTVDAMWAGYFSCIPFKWYEVAKYCTEMLMFAGLNCAAMNLQSYNKLPKDIRAIIDEMSFPNEKWWLEAAKKADTAADEGKKVFSAHGKIEQLVPGEVNKMDQLFAPIWTKWIADMEKKGLRPKEMLAEFYSVLKAAGVEKPFVGYTPGH